MFYFEVKNFPYIKQNWPLSINRQSSLSCIRDTVLSAMSLPDPHWCWCSHAQKPLLFRTHSQHFIFKVTVGVSGSFNPTSFFQFLEDLFTYKDMFFVSNRKCHIHALVLVTETLKVELASGMFYHTLSSMSLWFSLLWCHLCIFHIQFSVYHVAHWMK